MKQKIILVSGIIGILILAAYFRLFGVNWDQNQHLHPDERFLTMVSTGIAWPKNFYQYLDTLSSPLNPHNKGFGFFVYGTFPIFFTKWIAEYVGKGEYNGLTIVGRQLSAVMDIGTVMLVFLIAKTIMESGIRNQESGGKKHLHNSLFSIQNLYFPLLSMLFYASMVLPIQLSHYYAVETYLTFFITISFYILIRIIDIRKKQKIFNRKYLILTLCLGLYFGLALSSKITAIFFLPIIILGFLILQLKNKNFFNLIILSSIFILSSYFSFRITQPYLFLDPNIFSFRLNPKVLNNWKELKSFEGKDTWFPPGVQWIKTKPYIYPIKNLVYWGLGLPLGTLTILALIYFISFISIHLNRYKLKIVNDHGFLILFLISIWVLILFLYQGAQFSKNMRYFYPIYPFFAILAALFFTTIIQKLKTRYKLNNNIVVLLYCIVVVLILIYPFSFMSLYSKPHSRVNASKWIYENVPVGSTLAGEHWDDFLPLGLDGKSVWIYKPIELPLYGAETKEKWIDVANTLTKADYVFLSSNRLYGSIMTYPERYYLTTRYYEALFDGTLGFSKVAEFTSRPVLNLPFIKFCLTPPFSRYGIVAKKSQECDTNGISFVDDYADESFTVYDHPKVIIFKKSKNVDYLNFLYQAKS